MIGRPVQVRGSEYDGAPHWFHPAYVVLERGSLLVTQTFAGTEVTTRDGLWTTPFDARGHYWNDRWYNVIRLDNPRGGGLFGFYCNVATPAEFDGEHVYYCDLQIDVRVYVEGADRWRVEVVDEDEFQEARRRYAYPETLVREAYAGVDELRRLIEERAFPFTG